MHDKDRLLRTFIVVARSGSLRSAAQKLDLTQPAISKQIASLETFVGSALFTRHGRGVRLTPLGEQLVDVVQGGFAVLDAALDDARRAHSVVKGSVSIATVNTLASYLVPAVVATLRQSHEALTMRVHNASSPDVVDQVARGLADIGLVYDLAVDTDAVTLRRLYQEDVSAYCLMKAEGAQSISIQALQKSPLIVPPRPYAMRRIIERELPGPLWIAVECNSVSVSLDLAMTGIGTTFLPTDLPDVAVIPRGLQRLRIQGASLRREVVAIFRASDKPTESIAVAWRAIETCALSIRTRDGMRTAGTTG